MSIRIGLISDVHASPAALARALEIFTREAVDKVFCAGDIAGYFDELADTIAMLEAADCDCIIGNHDQDYLRDNLESTGSPEFAFLQSLPKTRDYQIEGRKFHMVHAHPPHAQHGGIKLLDLNGQPQEHQRMAWSEKLRGYDYDVLIVGHTHQVFAEYFDRILVINPGSTVFNHSCMVLALPDLSVKTFALSNQEIIPSWNFSYLFGNRQRYPPTRRH